MDKEQRASASESSAGIMIDTPEGLQHFAMAQCIARLRLETGSGLTFRQSTLKVVQRYYGIEARTKKAALEQLEDLYESIYGRRYGQQ